MHVATCNNVWKEVVWVHLVDDHYLVVTTSDFTTYFLRFCSSTQFFLSLMSHHVLLPPT